MTETRSRKFFYNTLFTALLQVVTIVSTFIVPRFMLKYYGSEINGLVTSITQFVAYFNLVEAGLSSAAVYALYKPLAEKDSDRISEIVSASKKFYLQAGYIFVSLTIGLAVFYPLYVTVDGFSPVMMGVLVLVLGANGCLEFFSMAKYRVLLTADQKTYIVSISSIVQIVVQTGIIALLSVFEVNIVVVRAVAILSIVLRTIILNVYCRVKYKNVSYKAKPDMKALDKRWDAMFLQVLGAIHKGTTVLLLTIIVKDLTLISVFSIFQIVVSGLNAVLGIFSSGLSASFGDVIVRGETKTLQKSYKEFELGYYLVMTFLYGVAFVMIMSFVKLYTRDADDPNIYLQPIIAYLLLTDGVAYNIKNPQGMLVISAGMYKETKWRTLTQGLIALVGGAILAFPFGIYGILAASIASNLYRDFDLFFFSAKRITGLSPFHSFKNIAVRLISLGVILLPFFFFEIQANSWLEWVLYSVAVCAYAAVVLLVFALIFDFKLLKNGIKRFIRIFKRG